MDTEALIAVRFTDRARQVMQFAEQEARRFNHEYIGTEHILLGLVKEGSGVAGQALANLGLDLRTVRIEVEREVQGRPSGGPPGRWSPLTPWGHKVLEHAAEEARHLDHHYVGTEHLLLGLLHEKESVAARVLVRLGGSLDTVRGEIYSLLGLVPAVPASANEPALALDAPPNMPAGLKGLDAEIERLTQEKQAALAAQDFEKAAQLHAQVNALEGQKQRLPREGRKEVPAAPHTPDEAETGLYDRFTGQARRVLLLAHREAQRFSHDYLGTEHILLGVLREGSGAVARLLEAFGADPKKIAATVEKMVEYGAPVLPIGRLPLTPPARRALRHAQEEAARLHHPHVGPEHLLLGLLHEPEGEACQALVILGLDLERLRKEVLELPPAENRDAMLQPEPRPGAPLAPIAADPTARDLAGLVSEKVVDMPKRLPAPPAERTALSDLPLLTEPSVTGLALQLRVTQFILGALAGAVAGSLLGGRSGGFYGLLIGLALAAVRNTALSVLVGVFVGILLGAVCAPRVPALQFIGVVAGCLIGSCLGNFIQGFAPLVPTPSPQDRNKTRNRRMIRTDDSSEDREWDHLRPR